MADVVADLAARLGLELDGRAWAAADKAIDRLKGGLMGLVGIVAGGFAVSSLVGMFEDVIEAGGQAGDLAAQIGISAESVQELAFGAKLAGVNVESLTGGLKKLSSGLVDASRTGKGATADAFRSLGISISSVKSKLQGEGGVDDVLAMVADKFAAMPNGMKKTSLAMDLFGKAGAQMIPFLNEGAAGIEKLRKEANDLGVVIDNDTVGDIDSIGDDLDRVKAGWQGVKTQAMLAIIPLAKELMPALVEKMKEIVAWVREHKTEIAAAFFAVGKVISTVGGFLADLVRFIVEVVKFFVWLVRKIVQGLVALGKWFADIALTITRAFATAFEWAAEKAAWLWNSLKAIGRAIVDAFIAAGEGIKAAFAAAWDFIKKGAKDAAAYVGRLPIIKQLGDVGRAVGGALAPGSDDGKIRVTTPDGQTREFGSQEEFNKWNGSGAGEVVPARGPDGEPLASNQQVNVTVGGITVNAAEGQDEKQVAEAVAASLSDVLRQQIASTGGRVS